MKNKLSPPWVIYNLFINFAVCNEPDMIFGPDDRCVCLTDTYHESWDVCVPCPPYSSTLGLIGAQSVHECGKCDQRSWHYLS